MAYGLTDEQIDQLRTVLHSNSKVNKIILFGSRAMGKYSPGSDIDLAIKGADLSLDDLLLLKHRMDESNLPFRVDIVLYDRVQNQELTGHINRVGIEL